MRSVQVDPCLTTQPPAVKTPRIRAESLNLVPIIISPTKSDTCVLEQIKLQLSRRRMQRGITGGWNPPPRYCAWTTYSSSCKCSAVWKRIQLSDMFRLIGLESPHLSRS